MLINNPGENDKKIVKFFRGIRQVVTIKDKRNNQFLNDLSAFSSQQNVEY